MLLETLKRGAPGERSFGEGVIHGAERAATDVSLDYSIGDGQVTYSRPSKDMRITQARTEYHGWGEARTEGRGNGKIDSER